MSRDETQYQPGPDERELRAALHRASLDAPRTDLWPRLAGEVAALAGQQARGRRRFLLWRQTRSLLAATLGILVLAGIFGVAWQLFSARTHSQATRGEVGDALLLIGPSAGLTSQAASLQPGGEALRILVPNLAGEPLVAPDGEQVYLPTRREEGGQTVLSIVIYDRELRVLGRTLTPGLFQVEDPLHPRSLRFVVAGDRLYAVVYGWQKAEPLTIYGYDRLTGEQRDAWTVETGGAAIDDVSLYVTPDERQLLLFASLLDSGSDGGSGASGGRTVAVRVALPAGRLERRDIPGANPTVPLLYGQGSRITPDGRALYRLNYDGRLSFFDLRGAGGVTTVSLFDAAPGAALVPLGQTTSPDGRLLYVVLPTRGEVVVVDLLTRGVERKALGGVAAKSAPGGRGERFWDAVRGLFVTEAAANNNVTAPPQLSPDGKTLYAIGATGRGDTARVGGVWAIDLASWRITAHWQPETTLSELILSGDGRLLYAQQGERLLTLDTQSGAMSPLGAWPLGSLTSPAQLYRERYGRSPAIAGLRVGETGR